MLGYNRYMQRSPPQAPIFWGKFSYHLKRKKTFTEMNVTGSFMKCVNLKICINLIWPAVFEVYCQMAGRVQIKYQALLTPDCNSGPTALSNRKPTKMMTKFSTCKCFQIKNIKPYASRETLLVHVFLCSGYFEF